MDALVKLLRENRLQVDPVDRAREEYGKLLALVDKGPRAVRWSDALRERTGLARIQSQLQAVERVRPLTAEETTRIRERLLASFYIKWDNGEIAEQETVVAREEISSNAKDSSLGSMLVALTTYLHSLNDLYIRAKRVMGPTSAPPIQKMKKFSAGNTLDKGHSRGTVPEQPRPQRPVPVQDTPVPLAQAGHGLACQSCGRRHPGECRPKDKPWANHEKKPWEVSSAGKYGQQRVRRCALRWLIPNQSEIYQVSTAY